MENIAITNNSTHLEPVGEAMTNEINNSFEKNEFGEEFFASLKDSRLSTKKAINGSISSATKVEKQNEEIINECKRQLNNRYLMPDQRLEILRIMDDARRDSVDVDRENREFVNEKLNYLNAMPWIVLGVAVLAYGGGKLISCKK